MTMKRTEYDASAIRRDWDDRARKNAFHYIASWRENWDVHSFLMSGEEDYQRCASPLLERCKIPTGGKVAVELGCGVGRMTRTIARHYQFVFALDLSAEMLKRGRQIHADYDNILWLQVSGVDLACLASSSVDFVFSYLVLQHLPNEEIAFTDIREMLRVLKPNGGFLFQFNGSHAPTMNLRGRIAWGLVDVLWSTKLVGLSRAAASLLGLDPSIAGKSWRGAPLEAGKVVTTVNSSGGEVCEMTGLNTPMSWCCGLKMAKV
jgi:ubiquinone/menaquinone biosynthesis C-methylase UbiE